MHENLILFQRTNSLPTARGIKKKRSKSIHKIKTPQFSYIQVGCAVRWRQCLVPKQGEHSFKLTESLATRRRWVRELMTHSGTPRMRWPIIAIKAFNVSVFCAAHAVQPYYLLQSFKTTSSFIHSFFFLLQSKFSILSICHKNDLHQNSASLEVASKSGTPLHSILVGRLF